MAQMEEQVNALLSNQETVAQLLLLTQSLTGDAGQGVRGVQNGVAQSEGGPAAGGPLDIQTLLDAILASETLDPAMRELLEALTGGAQARDETTALLLALRPFLHVAQQARLDQMLEVLRLSHIATLMTRALGGGDACV